MPSVPLPFVVTLLLLVLLVRMAVAHRAEPVSRAAMAFVAMTALSGTVVGLRWTFDLEIARFLQPIVASCLPPAAWLAFSALSKAPAEWRRLAPRHGLPVLLVVLLVVAFRPPLDIVLVLEFLGYGMALMRQSRRGPDGFTGARLDDAARAAQASGLAGILLVASSLSDFLIALDFSFAAGEHAATIVAVAGLLTLAATALTVALIGTAKPTSERTTTEAETTLSAPAAGAEDAATLVDLDRLMTERRPFLDPDLTLERLARKAGIPARQISAAVNRLKGTNVSQWVNGYRVAEAQRLLSDTDLPIISVMFDAGFQTKSNFNREFRRIAGMSPGDYRRTVNGAPRPLPESR